MQNFLEFLYDKQTGKVLGRTGRSWLEITVAYILFYGFLAGFWAACLAVFVKTLDDKVPRYYGKGSIIGINPGMGYQPWLREDPESTLIHFNKSNRETYQKFVDRMNKYLEKYEDKNNTRDCTGEHSNQDDIQESCRFSLDEFTKGECSKANDYGFKDGRPCVIISINRLIGWEPMAYPAGSAPQAVASRYSYKTGDIAVDCEGEYYADHENIGELKYIPSGGIQKKYYPYKVMKNYHQPIAMVKFMSPPPGILVEVECKGYAYNIIHDSYDRQGMVHFELLVDH